MMIARDQALDAAADALVRAVLLTASGSSVASVHREKFLSIAAGLDQREMVRRAAERVTDELGDHASPLHREQRIWNDARRVFSWKNLATLWPEGTA